MIVALIALNTVLVLYQLIFLPRRPLTWVCLALWLITGYGALTKINIAAH